MFFRRALLKVKPYTTPHEIVEATRLLTYLSDLAHGLRPPKEGGEPGAVLWTEEHPDSFRVGDRVLATRDLLSHPK